MCRPAGLLALHKDRLHLGLQRQDLVLRLSKGEVQERCRQVQRRGAGAGDSSAGGVQVQGRGDAGARVQVRKCGISGWSDGDLHDPDPVRLALLLRRLHEASEQRHLPAELNLSPLKLVDAV